MFFSTMRVQSLDAQGRYGKGENRSLSEEDLDAYPHRVTPEDEFAGDEIGEEESFDQDVYTVPPPLPPSLADEDRFSVPDPRASSTDDSVENPPVVTSGPPALPAASALRPREQVALSFVVAGVAAMDKEDVARAQVHFERAIEVAPLLPYSYYFLGRLALTRGEHQKALPLLRKADILLTRGDQAWRSEAMSAQGAVYEDLGEIHQARKAYRKSLHFSPQNLRAMSALARLAGEEPDSDDPIPQ